jgi:hypothetical protein
MRLRAVIVAVLALAGPGSAALLGDQLAWNSLEVSKRAVAAISARPLLATYCSMCGNERIEIFEVRDPVIKPTLLKDRYQVTVLGRRLFESARTFGRGGYGEPVAFKSSASTPGEPWKLLPLDLAYTYIMSEDGSSLRCLGTVLNLEPQLMVERINLPKDVALAIQVATTAERK